MGGSWNLSGCVDLWDSFLRWGLQHYVSPQLRQFHHGTLKGVIGILWESKVVGSCVNKKFEEFIQFIIIAYYIVYNVSRDEQIF